MCPEVNRLESGVDALYASRADFEMGKRRKRGRPRSLMPLGITKIEHSAYKRQLKQIEAQGIMQ